MFGNLTRKEIGGLILNCILTAGGGFIMGVISLNAQHRDVDEAVHKEMEERYGTTETDPEN